MGVIDEVKQRLDIVDVVSWYVTLTKAGRNFKALCPFHSEKTPSFIVFPERQSWRCFGACATGGDAFSFVMKVENLDFAQALRLLAQRAGVDLPERRGDEQTPILHQINQAAAAYFQGLLLSPQGKAAVDYLKGRGVSSEAISTFGLGLSPGGWDSLKSYLMAQGYEERRIEEAGLLYRGQDGGTRDLFRGRLMFPIHDREGRVAGFGARSLDGSDPKYLNSPRTPVFDKRSILYGLHLAVEVIRSTNQGVIVEGYMDVISAHQHGFRNVVASMGTSLTPQQVSHLQGLATSFVLALDPDVAGQEATLRSLESSWSIFERRLIAREGRRGPALYQRQQPELKIAPLPSGKDPDVVIRESPEEWQRAVNQSLPLMEYLLTSIASRFDTSASQGKAQAAEAVFPIIAAMDNVFEQDRYFQKLAQLLGVTPATLEASVGKPRPRRSQPSASSTPSASVSPFEAARGDTLEEYTLSLLLNQPQLRTHMPPPHPEWFHRSENRELFTLWLNCSTIEEIHHSLDEPLRNLFEALTARQSPPTDRQQAKVALEQCIRRLAERHVKELKRQEEALVSEGMEEALQGEILARNKQLKDLFSQGTRSRR